MSRPRRRALVVTLALGLSVLAVDPASAAPRSPSVISKPGTMVKVYRGDVKRRPGASSARAQRLTVVPGAAATPRSTWIVSYDAGFNANPQAKNAFQAAVDIWAGIMTSSVPIRVAADFGDLGPGVLGFAGPHAILPPNGGGDGVSWYPVALLNALRGSDQLPPSSGENGVDIDASFSSTEPGIYYGTDSNPPAGDIDFESVVLHELGHGLGFAGSADHAGSLGHYDAPRVVFDYFNNSRATAGTKLITLPDDSTTLGSAFTSQSVYWDGAKGTGANGGSRPRLYAPNPWEDGSSIAHLDEAAYPQGDINSLMTPYVDNQEVVHTPGPITIGMMREMGWNAVLTAPAEPAVPTAEPDVGKVTLSWTAPAPNGSPITSYQVNVTDTTTSTVTQVASPGTGTSIVISDLDRTRSYTFTVQAINAIGTGPASPATAPVTPGPDTTPPSVTVSSVHITGVGPATGAYAFVGTDPGHTNPTLTYACSLDQAAAVTCTSPFSYGGYAHGSTHSFSVTPTDAAGNTGATATVASWTADGQVPSVTTAVLPTYTLASTVGLTSTGTDVGSGVKNYDFRWRRAAFSGGWSALTYAWAWQGTTHNSVAMSAVQGYTYCFAVRVRDGAGNESAWSAERCTSTAIDDRGLYAGAGWVRGSYPRHFMQTITQTTRTGVTLTRTNVQTLRLALVAVKCHTCGTVGIYFNGRLIKNVNLKQTATQYQVVFPIISFPSLQSGTVVIKPLTAGTFFIDGLVMSKV